MDTKEVKKAIKGAVYREVEKVFRKRVSERKEKYIQMAEDMLCKYQSKKEFLSSSVDPEDLKNMPADLVKEYEKKIESACFLTSCIEDAIGDIDDEFKKLIDLIYFQHKLYPQIAEELFCSTCTVWRWRRKALERVAINIFGIEALGLEEI